MFCYYSPSKKDLRTLVFYGWSQWQETVRAEYQKVTEYQKQAVTEFQRLLVSYKKKVKGKYVPENSICFQSTQDQRTHGRIPMKKTNGNLSLPWSLMKRKSSGKTVVFKSLCLAFEGSNTNTGAAGPITKATVKRKSEKAVKYFQQSWGRGGDRQLQKKDKVSHLLGVYQASPRKWEKYWQQRRMER